MSLKGPEIVLFSQAASYYMDTLFPAQFRTSLVISHAIFHLISLSSVLCSLVGSGRDLEKDDVSTSVHQSGISSI